MSESQKFMRASVASRWVGRVSRLPTPESKAWDRDLKARAKHVKDALAAFRDLLKALQPYADRAQAEFPGKDQESLQRRGRVFVKFVKDLPELNAYLDKWVGANSHDPKAYSWRSQVLYQARNVLTLGAPLKDALVEIGKQADKGFEALALAESQKPLREVLPEELRAYLPQRVVVEVDPAGVIKKVTDRFETEYETLGVKVQTMHALVRQYNAIAQQVKRDLKSGDELTRMAALVTAIIMETGIRPGKEGNGFVKVQDGNEVDIETFGAITLGPTHVKFVRDNFVRLEFVGKKGSTNVAHLTDAEVVRLLGTYVEQAKKGGSTFVFVTSKGVPFTYTDLQRYFREHFAGFSPTDFRKLKATDTVLTNLREEQQTLYARIRGFAQTSKKDLKERVVQEVVTAVQRAYERAQEALSHEDVATTIRAYVNPEILLRFLSQGKVEESLSSAILTGKTTLSFDPDVFVAHALKTSGQRTGAVLMDLLMDLEADMQAEGIQA